MPEYQYIDSMKQINIKNKRSDNDEATYVIKPIGLNLDTISY